MYQDKIVLSAHKREVKLIKKFSHLCELRTITRFFFKKKTNR